MKTEANNSFRPPLKWNNFDDDEPQTNKRSDFVHQTQASVSKDLGFLSSLSICGGDFGHAADSAISRIQQANQHLNDGHEAFNEKGESLKGRLDAFGNDVGSSNVDFSPISRENLGTEQSNLKTHRKQDQVDVKQVHEREQKTTTHSLIRFPGEEKIAKCLSSAPSLSIPYYRRLGITQAIASLGAKRLADSEMEEITVSLHAKAILKALITGIDEIENKSIPNLEWFELNQVLKIQLYMAIEATLMKCSIKEDLGI